MTLNTKVFIFDAGFSLLAAALGLFCLFQGLDYGYLTHGTPGPGFFPFWAGLAVALASCLNALAAFRRFCAGTEADTISMPTRNSIEKACAILAYFVGIAILGMLVSSALYLLGILTLKAKMTLPKAALLTISACLVVYAVFEVWLFVPLPKGIFGLL